MAKLFQLFIYKGRTVRLVRSIRSYGPCVDVEDVVTADRFENVPRSQLRVATKPRPK